MPVAAPEAPAASGRADRWLMKSRRTGPVSQGRVGQGTALSHGAFVPTGERPPCRGPAQVCSCSPGPWLAALEHSSACKPCAPLGDGSMEERVSEEQRPGQEGPAVSQSWASKGQCSSWGGEHPSPEA